MIRLSAWVICLALLAPPSARAALWEESFGGGLGAWTVLGDQAAAQVAPDAGKTGPGLRLGSKTPVVAVSPPLAGTSEDWLALTVQVRHASGAGALTLAMVAGAGDVQTPPVPAWRCDLPADGKWHRVDLTLSPPPGDQWRLALGVGADGLWTVDDLSLAAPPAGRAWEDPWLKDLRQAVAPEALAADWLPEGTLDAKPRGVGDTTELVVKVGGLALSLPAEAAADRGERHPVLIYVDNRGQVDKDLTVAVQVAGPDAYMPTYTVPIKSGGTTALRAPVQAMQAGDCWAKFTFTVGTESASAPLKLHVKEAYPALGVDESASSASSLASRSASLPFVQFSLNSLQGSPQPGQGLRLPLPAADPLAALQPALEKYHPPLAQLAAGDADPAVTPAQVVAAYQALVEGALPNLPGTALVSPSWPVAASEKGLQPPPVMQAAFAAGLAKSVQSIAVGLAQLPAAGVVADRVDGRWRPLVNSFWQLNGQRYDFSALRAWLAQQGPAHPLLLDLSGMPASAAPRLEMLLLARLLLEQTWQGSTGVLLDAEARLLVGADGKPRSPVYEGVHELWRELAAAVPVVVPTGEDGLCGNRPDAPVRCWAFLRGAEGILFLANNTSAPQEVAAELRAEPTQLQLLRLRAVGPPVTREIQDVFRFTDEARTRHQPAVYVRLAPGEVVGLSLQLTVGDWAWLRLVSKMQPREQPLTGPPPASGDQPWYERGRPGF